MPEYYSSRGPRRDYEEGIRREPDYYSRSAHPQARRPQQGRRPSGNASGGNGRRPAPRKRRRNQPKLFLIAAVIVVLIVVVVVVFAGHGGKQPNQPMPTPTVDPRSSGKSNVTISTKTDDTAGQVTAAATASTGAQYTTLAQWLGDEDATLTPLDASQRAQVNDLSINTNLPDTWLNVLLLGTDERTSNESSRTDTMMICSINKETSEVKLTSIMRDTAVHFDDIGDYNGTYRINAANYFGGPEYAVKTVNECFDMNIQHYVTVNFFGFQKIAQALGGIEMDITKEEMEEINKNAVQQYKLGVQAGIDESDQINEYLEEYGEDTHLNGRQTLAYARIRKIDSDFSRADRQRKVLSALLEKVRGRSVTEIMTLALTLSEHVTTNLDFDTIVSVAMGVLSNGLTSIETYRLPINDSYLQESRNGEAMFYDCDWNTNARELYNFIYE